MEVRLVKYDAACRALHEAVRIDDVKRIRDEAVAIKTYARLAKDRQLESDAGAIRMRAERRVGELMAAQAEAIGKAPPGRNRVSTKPDSPPSLSEVGIDKNLAHRARKLAGMTDEQFEKAVDDLREDIEHPAPSRRQSIDEDDGIEAEVDPANYRTAFLLRVDAALSMAVYSGKPSKTFVAKARQVADAWEKLAQQMEKDL